ncbi:phosphotransferase [Natrialbaceae archaeon GCM10025810]
MLESHELEALADVAERASIREAAATVLEDHRRREAVLSELYEVERDAWKLLAAPLIGGRCLEVGAGFGRRTMQLASLCESVTALEPNVNRLRVAAARDDFEASGGVVPIHSPVDHLPFAPGSFDTIVADFTGRSGSEVRTSIGRLHELATDDGTVIFAADGWPRNVGLTDLMGLDERPRDTRELGAATPSAYRRAIDDAGFADGSVYAVLPDASRPHFVFDVESQRALERCSSLVFDKRGWLGRLAKPLVRLGARFGLLRRCAPSVVAVCTNDRDAPDVPFDDPLVIPGRSRSVVLESSGAELDRVWKVPNGKRHERLTERENAVLSHLHETDDPIVDTLPGGRPAESRFGEARVERPADGRLLEYDLAEDPAAYERVLRIGFDWLVEFQRTFRSQPVDRSPEQVRRDLGFEPAGLEPPPVDEAVTTFTTPVHGDFIARNVHVDGETVTSVIDWEYGAIEGNPIVDAGFLVVNTATRVLGDLEAGVRTALCEESPYADVTRAAVRRYCDALDVPVRTFEVYLPSVFVNRIELDYRVDAVSTYTETMDTRVEAAATLMELSRSTVLDGE